MNTNNSVEYGKNEKPISNVKCEVKDCIYNNHNEHCTAKQIKVGPQSACGMQDTLCETFIKQ